MKLGFYLFAEYVNMFISSAVIMSLYFGGYNLPFQNSIASHVDGNILALLQFLFFFGKVIFGIFFFMWIRWTIPRFRYDQLMNLGWKILIPLSIFNILATGVLMYALGKV